MFDVGFSELALIAILALLIAGPERLPGIMRGLGSIARRGRDVYTVMRNELEREMDSVKSDVTPQDTEDEHSSEQADDTGPVDNNDDKA
jgi:sec-independent protein translocase protein TatB